MKLEAKMKSLQIVISRICLVASALSFGMLIIGCGSNPDGEGLSDQQKLDGASKAREQQMAGQRGGAPMTRDTMPGQNAPK